MSRLKLICGATQIYVQQQFLIETVVLSLIGGAVGILSSAWFELHQHRLRRRRRSEQSNINHHTM